MQDKDVLANALSASVDARMATLDSAEDRLVAHVTAELNALVAETTAREHRRNRSRVAEIAHLVDTYAAELTRWEHTLLSRSRRSSSIPSSIDAVSAAAQAQQSEKVHEGGKGECAVQVDVTQVPPHLLLL